MAKHNVGDRRIVSVSIPEDVAQELDRWTGGGKIALMFFTPKASYIDLYA